VRLPPSATRTLVCGVLVLAAALAQAAERSSTPPANEGAGSVGIAAHARFRIRGNVEGLYPGATKWMRLRVRNPNPFAIRVTRIRSTVQSASGSTCPAKSMRIKPFKGSRRVPAAGTARVKVRVLMRVRAPETCAGQRYRLSYQGRAIRA
jgi:hypothetical protein